MITTALLACLCLQAPEKPELDYRPIVAGELELTLRERLKNDDGAVQVRTKKARWKVAETAIIICDMWDDHYCKLSAQRVNEMVPRMNHVLTMARSHGCFIVHAPSNTLDVYAKTPYRLRMTQAKAIKPPVPIAGWCYLDPSVEPPMPVETTECACDDPVVGEKVRRYSKQHDGLDIIGFDGISDSGVEIYNVCQQLGIKNIAIMGVHTNMCVLGRSFGIRQMTRLGMNVVLVRDLTDAMYDPRQPPHVSHARGTEMVIEHIEQYWCPSIESKDLTQVIEGSAGPALTTASAQKKPVKN